MRSCNYWVFREGRHECDGASVRAGLAGALQKLGASDCDSVLDALLRAGELETALADAISPDARAAARITDAVADILAGSDSPSHSLDSLADVAERLSVPDTFHVSTPEGFSYYALHPMDYAELARSIPLSSWYAAVIGIRSIGVTLSAVVMAAFARNGIRTQRITVRPAGHPYDRKTEFTPEQLCWIAANRSHDAEFLVVDEGPGLSGSSFLSVGDALLKAGVDRRRIRFLCSHQTDPAGLAAPNGAERWRGFQSHSICGPTPFLPHDAQVNCSNGEWRRRLYTNEADWPASWTWMERAKFLSNDHRRLFKFAGYGRYGATICERARLLSDCGFAPKWLSISGGFAEYEFCGGRPATASDLSRALVERIGDYCAWRASEFRTSRKQSQLVEMARFNLEQLTGHKPPEWLELEDGGSPVLCDSRMQPHEWILGLDGVPVKTDGESHGDDHFFPGPCDIAWDLAGAVVEWHMDSDATEALLRHYLMRSGDEIRDRIAAYLLAYAVFRAAFCSMAAFAMRGTEEELRLDRDVNFYQQIIERELRQTRREALRSSPVGVNAVNAQR